MIPLGCSRQQQLSGWEYSQGKFDQTSKQRKKTKSDAGQNRDHWAYYQLEQFTRYKAIREGVLVESIPAPYTSKSDHRNGVIGKRNRHWFLGFDGYRCNADWNASQVIGGWH
ncbi:MAG: hypothetical protein OHK0047_31970 [Leptolyngbyaceae cyanobacterium]